MVTTNIKTPGVYVEEISLFPPSVAEVATAIPAFIGYTEKAIDPDGKSLSFIPTRIISLKEYEFLFGKAFSPKKFIVTAASGQVTSVVIDKRFLLYDSLRQYFDNGGGPCYIVSVDAYVLSNGTVNDITIGDENSGLIKGLKQVEKYDEPTLLLFPDAVLAKDGSNKTDYTKIAELQKAALAQCVKLQDRFMVTDIGDGDKEENTTTKPITAFRDKIGVNGLNYGAAYYPWIVNTYSYDIGFTQLDLSAVTLPGLVPAGVSMNQAEIDLLNSYNSKAANIDSIVNILVNIPNLPGALADKKAGIRAKGGEYLSAQLAAVKQAITGTLTTNTNYFKLLNGIIHSFKDIEGALPDGNVKTDLVNLKKDTVLNTAIKDTIALERFQPVTTVTISNFTTASIKTFFNDMFSDGEPNNPWVSLNNTDNIALSALTDIYPDDQNGFMTIIAKIEKDYLPVMLNALSSILNASFYYSKVAETSLLTQHSFFKAAIEQATLASRTMPVSGAIAGIYAMVDNSRGVWKAPANVSLNGVIGPAVKINNKDQETLNVDTTGKSINAIRSFTGKGTLVWGGRTLAGNDNEWRYISVRRFFIMVEESVKKASEPFVFEPNDGNTWTKVKAMIENFLTLQWRAGALQGAKPNDAFFVHVGLGETMSEDDILNGRMIIEIGMAVVRPAEFIILRFSHKMMEK